MPRIYAGTAEDPKKVVLEWILEPIGLRGKAKDLKVYFGGELIDTKPNARFPRISEYSVGDGSVLKIRQITVGWMRLVRIYLDGVELKAVRDKKDLVHYEIRGLFVVALWGLVTSLLAKSGVLGSILLAACAFGLAVLERKRPAWLKRALKASLFLVAVIILYELWNDFNVGVLLIHGVLLYALFSQNKRLPSEIWQNQPDD